MILSTIASYVALHLFCAVCLQWVREVTQNHLRQTYWYAAMTSCVIPCICHTFLMSLRLHWGLLVCQVIGKLLQTSSMHAHVSLNEWTSPKVMFCVPDGVQVMWDTKEPIACAWLLCLLPAGHLLYLDIIDGAILRALSIWSFCTASCCCCS